MKVKIPENFGEYRRLYSLGKGLMSETFVASKRENGQEQRVAVKVCYGKVTRKLKAANVAANRSLDPRLIRYLDIVPAVDYECHLVSHFFKLKPAHRESFKDQTLEDIVEFYISVVEALTKLAEAKQVHGNIKPENIGVHAQRDVLRPMVLDIGLRYVYDPEYYDSDKVKQIVPYMAPEVAEAFLDQSSALPLTEQSDIYSVAATLVNSLTGRAPFLEDEEDTVEELIATKKTRRFRLIVKNDPFSRLDIVKLNELLQRSLNADIAARPQTMAELLNCLRECVSQPAVSTV